MKTPVILLSLFLVSCMPNIHPPGERVDKGRLLPDRFITQDGVELPLKTWKPEQPPCKAIVIALHGFNDYSHFFQMPGDYLRQRGILSYAYDQRGFGGSPGRGYWAGVDAYAEDLELFTRLVSEQHPGIPIYLLGQSMGGAVIIVSTKQPLHPQVKGIILAAPAVWSRNTMPWYQRMVLWTLAHTLPWLTLTGESVEITPSDNIELLRELGQDPLVIKETRVETIYGLSNLMDAAQASASSIQSPLLLLYGEKDEVIPKQPTYQFLLELQKNHNARQTIAFYKDGYHMLLRDKQAHIVWNDIVTWITMPDEALPSGADRTAEPILLEMAKKESPAAVE